MEPFILPYLTCGNIDLAGIQIKGEIVSDHSNIKGSANFYRVVFNKRASFKNVVFSQEVEFDRTTFRIYSINDQYASNDSIIVVINFYYFVCSCIEEGI